MFSALIKCGKIHCLLKSFTDHHLGNVVSRNISISCCRRTLGPSPPDDPLGRIKWFFAKGFQDLGKRIMDPAEEYDLTKIKRPFPVHADVLIIGAGAMGCSVAYWIKKIAGDGLTVLVIDKDYSVTEDVSKLTEYEKCSTVLSVGGLRQQFSLEENIKMSLFGAHFLQNVSEYLSVGDEFVPNIQFQPNGYLFLASEKGAETLRENSVLQNELGARNELLSPDRLKQKFPWINTDGVVLGCHGLENEGWFDPWTLLQAFKIKALSMGVDFQTGEVINFRVDEHVHVSGETDDEMYPLLEKVVVRTGLEEVQEVQFSKCVIAAGAFSGRIARLAGCGEGPGLRSITIPIEPRKRYVFTYHCKNGPGLNCPLTVDPSGVYFRREGFGGLYLAALSPESHEEPPVDTLDVDHSWFDEKIWPTIASRARCFEDIKVKNAWAGYYEVNTLDENGVIGLIPTFSNLYLLSGFSGHGIQHSPAAGRALAEMIIHGSSLTLDVERLSARRLYDNSPVFEKNIV